MIKFLAIAFSLCCFSISSSVLQGDESVKQHSQNLDSLYFEKVLCNNTSLGPYLAFYIDAPGYTGRVIIPRNALGYYFARAEGILTAQTREKMRPILLNDDTLKITRPIDEPADTPGVRKWAFEPVKPDSTVQLYASKGKAAFLEYFFEAYQDLGGGYRQERSEGRSLQQIRALKAAIINQLFAWRIYAWTDSYSGRLHFTYDDLELPKRLKSGN